MDERDRFVRENALVDAIADECVAARARIAAEEARMLRRLADAWVLAHEQTQRIGSADSRKRDMPLRCIAAQISAETHLSDRTVQTKMYDAWRLVTLFPATVNALEAGTMTKAHADVILDHGAVLEETDVRAAFETVVLEWAAAETVARTRCYARRLAEKLDPRSMQDRHGHAAEDRSVSIIDLDNGMSQIIALVPTVLAHAVLDRLTRQAKAITTTDLAARRAHRAAARSLLTDPATDADADAGADRSEPARFDERTVDQVRADVFTDMLLTGTPTIDPTIDEHPGGLGAIRAHVQITLPITTLTGITHGGAEIDGKTPIDPTTARHLAGRTRTWDRVFYDPVTATVLTVDRYTPHPTQRRYLHARDQHCRFPGCRTPARRCHLDHNHEHHDGGPTSVNNLACLCPRHHTLKTETPWTVTQHPSGNLEWTTPSGRTHTDQPPAVIFTPDVEPPPF